MICSASSERVRRTALGLVLLMGILVWAPTASAQSAADQYIPQLDKAGASDPDAGDAGTGASGTETTETTKPGTPAATETLKSGDGGGGTVPASGFPLTSFVSILGAAVLLALAARVLIPLLSRGNGSIRPR